MKNIFFVMVIFLIAVPAVQAQEGGWAIQPSPTARNLYGIAFSDNDAWVAIGDTGTIIHSSDGGINWNIISSPVSDALRAISFHDSIGVAVGLAGRVLRTSDRGISWIEEQRPTTRALYSVSMGDSMTVITGEEGSIFVSYDNGLTWQPHTAGTASNLFGVSVFADVGVGVGGRAAVVMSVDRGIGWGLTILGPPDQLFFNGTSLINSSTGWAVGSNALTGSIIIRTDNSGFVWNQQTTPTAEMLFGISASTIDTVTAVGGNGTIIHTTNGGDVWSIQPSGVAQILNAVKFANPRFGIAVGDGGTILRTLNGGLSGIEDYYNSPDLFTLKQNYPNPFNTQTTILYFLPITMNVTIDIFDISGRKVKTLAEGLKPAGENQAIWDARYQSSGIYFYRIKAGDKSETKKMVLIK